MRSDTARCRRLESRALLAAVLMAWAGGVAATVDAGGSLSVAAGYVDNINLAPTGAPIVSTATGMLSPSLDLRQHNDWATTALGYSLDSFYFPGHTAFNHTRQQLSANGDVTTIPNWIRIDGTAAYAQQLVNATGPINTQNVFSSGNQVDSLVTAVTPILFHRWSDTQFETRYTYGRVHYYKTGDVAADNLLGPAALSSSVNQTLQSHVGSVDESTLTWGADFSKSTVTYPSFLSFRTERAAASVGYLVGSDVRLLGEGGVESNLVRSTSAGGLGSQFWDAGARWTPGPIMSIEGRVGHRFFGSTYLLKARRTARLLNMSLSYTEEPTTLSAALIGKAYIPGVLQRPPPGLPVGTITPQAYLAKRLDAAVGLTGQRSSVEFSVTSEQRQYFNTGGRDRYQTAGVEYRRQLSPASDLHLGGSLVDVKVTGAQHGHYGRVTFGLGHRITERLRLSLDGASSSSSDLGAGHYRSWFVLLKATRTFGAIPPEPR